MIYCIHETKTAKNTRKEYYSEIERYISGEKKELRMDPFVGWARHRTTNFYYKHMVFDYFRYMYYFD